MPPPDPRPTPPAQLFVAFAGPDRDHARALVAHLRAWGCRVTWEEDIRPGRPFTVTIPEALGTCSAYVFLVTEASKGAWYQHDEVTIAVDFARSEGRDIYVVTDLAAPERPYGLASSPRTPWGGDAATAAFRIAADALGWQEGARDQPARIPFDPADSRYARYELAARLASAVDGDALAGAATAALVETLARLPQTSRFARILEAGGQDLLVVLRGALFHLADSNLEAAADWKAPLVTVAREVARALHVGGQAPPRLAAWLKAAGAPAPAAASSAPPALLVRLEGVQDDETFFLSRAELRRPDSPTLWSYPPAGSAALPEKRRTSQEFSRFLRKLYDVQLQKQGIPLDSLVLIVEVEACHVGLRFHRWQGVDNGKDLARQLKGVATWPCLSDAWGQTRARPPERPRSVDVPRPIAVPADSVWVRAPVSAVELNGRLGAGIAVFAGALAWRGADTGGPVCHHANRLLTVLLEDEDLDTFVDAIFGGDAAVPVELFFERLRLAWAARHEAHVVWTDARYTPSWDLAGPTDDLLFESL
ncbi:MAG: toll/interleukin-1 receptor domain-containing protein [Myxococcota bacterium]